ncbi:MAG: MGH1-like glycoside hydrolase domain-containing protein [Candidatus Binatia bacterium]
MTPEHQRLDEARGGAAWRKWGPYLSERQWGTVREDYSDDGNAWAYFTHDQARARAYRWGEDGLAGVSDEKQRLCFALALWNGVDPILKERLFGLTNSEGNHGEDVKEYYFYLDSTPTHSYMRYLYKYPQARFPYEDLVATNGARGRDEQEYELIDTGVFDADRYWDVFVEYAKGGPEELLIRITAHNRGPDPAPLHLLPTLWCRNTWSWEKAPPERPLLHALAPADGLRLVHAAVPGLGERWLAAEGAPELLFTENETNQERLFGTANQSPYVKDAVHERVVHGRAEAVNPDGRGTKVAAHYACTVPAGGQTSVCLRLLDTAPAKGAARVFGAGFAKTVGKRRQEADEYYAAVAPPGLDADQRAVMRQALAGMLWSKQYYYFDLDRWLEEHGAHPLRGPGKPNRNRNWFHMINDDVISMPDKWEYPWYAAWDLAFHCVALAAVDIDFAKRQLELMLRELYQHPSGQMPAYEWNFSDVNPPVHAWATLHIYFSEKVLRGRGDTAFLRQAFQKLLVNFTWWVNRKDPNGHNLFEGGFLGLDNIGVFDRSSPLPTGGSLEQADGTGWMALYAQNMLEIALELAEDDLAYGELALKFAEHFLWIAAAMDRVGDHADEMWDETDGFFYDVLRLPDGSAQRLKVRSLVGLLSLCATTVFNAPLRERFPALAERLRAFIARHPELQQSIAPVTRPGVADRRLLAVLNEDKLRRVLVRLLDENEFLSPYGIRSISRAHLDAPYEFAVGEEVWRVRYEPAESTSGMFGGNSNWRGPIWMPLNLLIVRALGQFYAFYGDDFTVECPTGSGRQMTLFEVGAEIGRRLTAIFLRDASGRRPVFGGVEKFQTDPHWRDHVPFYEYFHGDNGAGLGASHQTGWTGVVARLIQIFGDIDAAAVLTHGMHTGLTRVRQRTQGEDA